MKHSTLRALAEKAAGPHTGKCRTCVSGVCTCGHEGCIERIEAALRKAQEEMRDKAAEEFVRVCRAGATDGMWPTWNALVNTAADHVRKLEVK
jgi:hypothetical protein